MLKMTLQSTFLCHCMGLWDTIEIVYNKLRLLPRKFPLSIFFSDKKIMGRAIHIYISICVQKRKFRWNIKFKLEDI